MNTTTQTVTVKNIEAKPEYDPMVNIAGHCTKSEFWLDPRTNECGVSQEMRTNSTTEAIWHGHVRTVMLSDHPLESDIQRYIDDNMELLERVVAGYESRWNGSNHVARYTDDAESAWRLFSEPLEQGYFHGSGYAYVGDVSDWYDAWITDQIKADMIDEQIEKLARETVELDSEDHLDGMQLVFDHDAADTLIELCKEHRDELREEAE